MVRLFTSLVLMGFLVSAIHAPAVMAKVLSKEEIRATLRAARESAPEDDLLRLPNCEWGDG